jgi:Tol biopolymer transport system component
MTPEEAQKAEELFASLIELSPDKRGAVIDRACGRDLELRAEIESLLQWHDRAETEGWEPFGSPPQESRPILQHLRARTLSSHRVGAFELGRFLGEGATGVVYQAIDARTGQTVAIKIASAQTMGDIAGRRRFERAAAATMALDHPNIARVKETGSHRNDSSEELVFAVLEYVEGRTLMEELRLRKLDVATALGFARRIADAMDYAHGKGIVHRDLKPANIMVTRSGALKVLDFGLCHALPGKESLSRTRTGLALGTLGYTAPEQARGEPPTPQSDLFSLGAVLYEMLSGEPAFHGRTPVSILSSVLQDTPARPLGVPHQAVDLALWCMEKEPARRPESAAAIVAEIDRLRERPGILHWLDPRRAIRGAIRQTGRLRHTGTALRSWKMASAITILGICAIAAAIYQLRAPGTMAVATEITHGDGILDTEPALSPDRKWIAFASDRGGDGHLDLWIVPASGGTARRLTHDEINARQPEFSPNSRTIVYRSDRDGGGIFRIAADAADQAASPAVIVRGGLRPRFSPDGNWIAYWDGLEGSGDILGADASRAFVVPARGGPARPICPSFAASAYPVWSADGSSILFTGRRAAGAGFDHEAIIWVTPFRQCAPVPVGTQGDFPGFDYSAPVIPERWLGNHLLFRDMHETIGLEDVAFSTSTGRIVSAARRLALPVQGMHSASVLDSKTITFAQAHVESSLWSMPVDSRGHAGELELTTRCASPYCVPSLSADGSVLLYSRHGDAGWEFIRRDIHTAGDEVVAEPGLSSPWPFLLAHGRDAVYVRQSASGSFTAFRAANAERKPYVICKDCPELWDVSSSGKYALSSEGVTLRTVGLIDMHSGVGTELLAHPRWNLYRASFSMDERNVLFTAKLAPDRSQIFVARFRNGRCDPPSEWIPVTGSAEYNGPAHWSPAGNLIYFTSQSDGYRCLYARNWDKREGAPVDPIITVRHFHATSPTPGLVAQSLFGFAVSRDRLVIVQGEQRGRIWLMH